MWNESNQDTSKRFVTLFHAIVSSPRLGLPCIEPWYVCRTRVTSGKKLISPLTFDSSASFPGSNQVWQVPSQAPTRALRKSFFIMTSRLCPSKAQKLAQKHGPVVILSNDSWFY